uniref:Uncharacterized protein n=1 Tax=Schlesneria paludicola TaxID=360056 RepID=A0A7C2JX77_9PLAN
MYRSTLIPLFALTALAGSAGTASAQSMLNPFSWFAPQPVYGVPACPNGQCGPAYGANCVGGNCLLPGGCVNGQCGLPNNCPNGYCPPTMGRYGTNPSYAPYYGNAPYAVPRQTVPQYQPYQPYSAQRPMTPTSVYRSSYDRPAPATSNPSRSFSPSNSPFYP